MTYQPEKTINSFSGVAGSPGRAVGPVYRWEAVAVVGGEQPNTLEVLQAALAAADTRLARALSSADATLSPLLEAQRLMLGDPEFRDVVIALVQSGVNARMAVSTVSEEMAAVLEGADSQYFRERAIDVRAVGTLVIEALAGGTPRAVPAGAVVIAEELAPLDTAELAEAGIAAMITVRGGPTCHAAIIARSWGIPAVVGAPIEILAIAAGTPVLVDGSTGRIVADPAPEEVVEPVAPAATAVHITRRVPIYANINSVNEAARALAAGAEGVGLLRTEFLFQRRTAAPSEEEQTAQYTAILQQMDRRPVIIRTLDIGADKPAPFLPMPAEPNPQLGLRGLRLCLRERALFVTQLRALLRAQHAGVLKIMLPMVTTVGEVEEARALLREQAAALNVPVPPLGAMIEVPMAALAAPELAAVCDFFSLGTNDLMQFLLAADRQHAGVGYLHTADHPAIWRLLAQVIDAAHAAHIPVGVCGEWGAAPEKLTRLIDLGIDSASVAVGAVARVLGWFAR